MNGPKKPKSPSTSARRSSRASTIRAFFIAILVGFTPFLNAQDSENEKERDAYTLLDAFVGTWSGTLILSNSEGQIIQLTPLKQSYWWEDHLLKGLAVFGSDDRLNYANSDTSIENGLISAIIREGDNSKVMKGTPTERGLIWIPEDPTRIGAEQTAEYVTQVDDQIILVIDGFERVKNPPLEQRVYFRAELVKQP